MILQSELDKERIEYYSNQGMPLKEVIKNEIKKWLESRKRATMIKGQNYYLGENLDIDTKNRYYLDEDGDKVIDNENRRNSILKHNHTRTLVDQKAAYLLGNGLEVSAEDKTYEDLLKDRYFTKEFNRRLKNTGTDSVNKGIAWWQVYYDKGKLKLKTIPSEEVIPLWADAEHSKLDAIIRTYVVEVYDAKEVKEVRKVEYYDLDGVQFFEFVNGELVKDIESDRNYSVIIKTKNAETGEIIKEETFNWEKIPFIYLKYNQHEKPLISYIDTLIDDYDWSRSEFSDGLADVLQGITIVEGYGEDPLEKIVANIFKLRAARVDVGGDVRTLDVSINTDAAKFHQEQTKNAIYEAGRGVQVNIDKFGNTPSGIALRILYSALDLDCDMWQNELEASLEYLRYFINVDIVNNPNVAGTFNLEELQAIEVEYIFSRNVMINDVEVIETLEKSTLSEQSKIENNPYAAKDELERIKAERKEIHEDNIKYPPFRRLGEQNESNEEE